ncbi:MAG TPA: ABC transporter ATP-binding protein, partial [Thermodesulfobacteriota bacterium]|nr:ABC transporter ATP-binding protein [Thermodesulfobacteriota bacterium]
MIEVKGVTKHFGNIKAVDSVSFNVDRGEAVALLGPNGAGKSTLIKCILGLLDFRGEIKLNDIGIKDNPKGAKTLIGYVPQESVFYDMKAIEILRFFGSIRRVKKGKIEKVLDTVGLREHAFKNASALSGGMRQRLSFAIALLSEPLILILDEPTSNLDAYGRADFLKLIKELKKNGKTVLFSSHRLDEVDYLADRVLVMKTGRLVLESPPHSLAEKLGLKVKMAIKVPPSSLKPAVDLLNRNGFDKIGLNGSSKLYIEITSKERILPLKALLLAEIPIDDFTVE